ncbi:MAG: MauE/DoxX family redox-associated membrane protein [Patescibacteria group bacterium]
MFKKILPLLSIFAFIILLTISTAIILQNFGVMNLMMMSMAYFFIVFGLFKLSNLQGFAKAYAMYDILAMKSKTYALSYPFIEVILGLMYLLSFGGIYRDVFTFFIMSISAYGVWKALQVKDEIPCACLGTVFKVPMTKVTLFENVFMALMALYMIWMYLAVGNMPM